MKIPDWRFCAYALVILIGIAVASPSFLPRDITRALPGFLPSTPVSLGLDLRGGASLTLRADEAAMTAEILSDAREALSEALADNDLRAAIRIEGQTLAVTGGNRDQIRPVLEKTIPAFQRSALNRAEPAFTLEVAEGGDLILTLRAIAVEVAQVDAMAQSIEVVRKPVDEAGVAEPSIQRLGQDRILVQMPGVSDPAALRALLGSTAELTFHRLLPDPGPQSAVSAGAQRLPMADGSGDILVEKRAALHGENRADASAGFHPESGRPVVQFRFDTEGAVLFGELTQELVGRPFAIVLDGTVLSAPVIREPVLGGSGEISGSFTVEETARGKKAASAVQAGFDRAYRAIMDSNVTTLIATCLLFWLGSGPVRGFALTTGLEILISLFTAVTVVRSAMDIYLRVRQPKTFVIRAPFDFLKSKATPALHFMRMRFAGLAVSLVLSVGSIVLFVTPGLNYGVDFRGGTLIEAHFDTAADMGALRGAVEALALGDVSLQQSDADRTVLIRIEEQPGGEAAQTRAADQLRSAVTTLAADASFERVEIVGPRVNAELAVAGILAVVAASLAMLVYIWARFDWPFAVGAIVTLILDVTKVVGFFALTAIAALLTLIGYSVDDKVVVYDRMRENLSLHKSMSLRDLIDLSINQTLARSFYTSVTALAAMLPMAIWGGAVVQSFAIPMVFGIVIAAGSSVFIAAPILLFLGDWQARRKTAQPASTALQTTT